MAKVKIKSGDEVQIIAGEQKGREGKVLKVFGDRNKALVEGINVVKKHLKPSASNPQGGISDREAPIHISNLALLDTNGKPTRVGFRLEDGEKVRFAKTTNDAI